MRKLSLIIISIFLFMIHHEASSQSRKFQSFDNDPMKARIYTLPNGLTVYLTVNKDKPRVQTYIAVKAGSKFDPKETTGLAHYLEHMMFKGTHQYGTVNWAQEEKYLQQLSSLFEAHKNETNPSLKSEIYKKIDSVSYEASKLAIPSEYDKMVTSIGAKGTNAYTSNDQTVYVNDIPSSELKKWIFLESNRFQTLVLRLFHTELETVYEEFNRSQDNDGRWSYQKVWTGLLPQHPYGTQTTIGEGEHLKNPSMVNIHNYFHTYYRPNNIAICLSGDLDPDKTIEWIEKSFGDWKPGKFPELTFPEPTSWTGPKVMNTYGPQAEHVYVGFLGNGAGTKEVLIMKMMDMILSNGKAGILDIDLIQKQKALEAYAMVDDRKDYSSFMLYGKPRQGQSLEEVKDLLLASIEKIKKGNFDESLMKAVVTDLKYRDLKRLESNSGRANVFVETFIYDRDYLSTINETDDLMKITKEEVVSFANKFFNNGYVISYKRIGEDKERHKVDKPKITPVVINRDSVSDFIPQFNAIASERLSPIFIDFDKEIEKTKIHNDIPLEWVKNPLNKTFQLTYNFEMGSDHSRELTHAMSYLKYLGTDQYSAEELKFKLYSLGLSFDVYTSRKNIRLTLTGLESSLVDGITLLEHVIHHVKPDQAIYDTMVNDILKLRKNSKLNKGYILQNAMADYMMYGAKNPTRDMLSETELKAMQVNTLTQLIHNLFNYKHNVFYYGTESIEAISTLLKKHHQVQTKLLDCLPATQYVEQETNSPMVFFYPFEMVQAEMLMIHKDELFNKSLSTQTGVFNEYFGSGLSSIVFQEIREKKALAYSANCNFSTPSSKEEAHYIRAYIGTQADKLKEAVPAMQKLLTEMPESEKQFNIAREAALIRLETDPITRADKYWTYDIYRRRGVNYDYRKDIYEGLKTLKMEDLSSFYTKHIAKKPFSIAVIGDPNKVDLEYLKTLGTFKQLTDDEVFHY